MCWRAVSEMVALKCKSSDPDVGEHDSDLTTNGMHTVLSACIRNAKSCHLWRYDVYNLHHKTKFLKQLRVKF